VRTAIDLKGWKLAPPRAGTSQPLTVEFSRPLDRALIEHEIVVVDSAGNAVQGKIKIEGSETRWLFSPDRPWIRGSYSLRVGTLLADLAGNTVNRPFEIDRFEEIQKAKSAHPADGPNARLVPFIVVSK
jgi:hypothetical protein